MKIETAIKKAIKAEWKPKHHKKYKAFKFEYSNGVGASIGYRDEEGRTKVWILFYELVLDPEFWKALGKSEGWKDNPAICEEWKHRTHRFMDNINDGQSLEEAFNNATK